MNLPPAHTAALATAIFIFGGEAPAETFDARWGSLFAATQVASDPVSAKAELTRPKEVRKREVKRRSSARRYSFRGGRSVRHREWYKGGKKWRYVYSRRR